MSSERVAAAPNYAMFRGKCILAPMVRVGGLPFRLTCLHYGADLVYAEEIIAQRFLQCTKVENSELGSTDFYDVDGGVCFRTTPKEKEKVIFQMGVSEPQVAVECAKMIEPFVAGIDINMGCPKDYSIKGNMGAALLTQPALIKEILTSVVAVCSKPVTCKIRILDTEEATITLCKMIESTGVSAVTIHGRTRYTRSSLPCNYDVIKTVKKHLTIPVILNGASLDVQNREDMARLIEETGADSIMVARAAWLNPAIFNLPEPRPIKEAVHQYMKYCIDYDITLHILKFTMGKFRGAFKENDTPLAVTKHIDPRLIYRYFGLEEYYDEVLSKRKGSAQEEFQKNKRQKLDNGYIKLEVELTPQILQTFRSKVAPKQILNQWLIANGFSDPEYWTTEANRTFTGYVRVDNDTYVIEGYFKNKKMAVQAVSYAYCAKHHIELRHYKTGTKPLKGAVKKCKCADKDKATKNSENGHSEIKLANGG